MLAAILIEIPQHVIKHVARKRIPFCINPFHLAFHCADQSDTPHHTPDNVDYTPSPDTDTHTRYVLFTQPIIEFSAWPTGNPGGDVLRDMNLRGQTWWLSTVCVSRVQCTDSQVYIRMYVCMHVCMYVYKYVCMDVCIRIRIYTYLYLSIYPSIYIYVYVYVHIYVHVCVCVCVYVLFQSIPTHVAEGAFPKNPST